MKVNELEQKQKEQQFKQDLGYEEWIQTNNPESKSCDLDNIEMEKVFCKARVIKTYKYPLNNLHYQPLQGA